MVYRVCCNLMTRQLEWVSEDSLNSQPAWQVSAIQRTKKSHA